MSENVISVKNRDTSNQVSITVEEFINKLVEEIKNRDIELKVI